MKTAVNIGVLLLSLFSFSCAHSVMRGSVAMKISDSEAHVCLGEGEVKIGDRVKLYRNVCKQELSAGKSAVGATSCRKAAVGMGTVEKILNEHYSVVKFEDGVKFEEGAFVEKQ
jgi:hypothetical protein